MCTISSSTCHELLNHVAINLYIHGHAISFQIIQSRSQNNPKACEAPVLPLEKLYVMANQTADVVVAEDGSGNYTTVTAAIAACHPTMTRDT
jgi:hypothetical protein